MTSPGSQSASHEGAKWVFNAPPGWPASPTGRQPSPGWRPDPSWPPAPDGWDYWKPAYQTPGPRATATPESSSGQDHPGPGRPAVPSNDELAEALQILFPLRSWLNTSAWRQGLRLLVIAYAMLPLLFLAIFASSANLTTPGWTYSLYIAPLWCTGPRMIAQPAVNAPGGFVLDGSDPSPVARAIVTGLAMSG
jgi:hypothetical protein